MDAPDAPELEHRIQRYYGELFDEGSRLTTRSAQGQLEFDRTQEIIRAHVSGGRVLDVGGGSGVHSVALRQAGCDVELVDPVARHVDAANDAGVAASLGDARALQCPDESFDAVLLLGPLYHLVTAADRRQAIREATRVTRPGGFIFAAAIPRLAALCELMVATQTSDPRALIELLRDGTPVPGVRFPAGHYHSAAELQDEIEAVGGLRVLDVHGVEGPAGTLLEHGDELSDEVRAAALTVARASSTNPWAREMSNHLLAVARKVDG